MALKAGYKGIKKKYADAINNGQGGGGGGGFTIKKIDYTGAGTTDHVVEFPEKPQFVFGIVENVPHNGYLSYLSPFVFGAPTTYCAWRKDGTSSASAIINLFYDAENDKKITIKGSDAGQSMDWSNGSYSIYYI